jgi:imidazolonepropionase
MTTLLFRNARIFTPEDKGAPLAGPQQNSLHCFSNGAMLVRDGLIAAVGEERSVLSGISSQDIDREEDLQGYCVIPGFVDAHTHMCFARTREAEFSLRLEGTPYLEILKSGGGILSSVRAVRSTDQEALFQNTLKQVRRALGLGTTSVEIKSGYGLDTASELKMLAVIERIGRETPLDVVATFLGAHAVPEEFAGNSDGYVAHVIAEMLPAVAEQGIARYCDVFCEKGVFSLDQSRRILQAAAAAGLRLKIHADEVNNLGGAGLAAQLGAVSAEHLLAADDIGIAAMARAGTVAILLPATAYSLKKAYAPARKMIAACVPVALATDCNPGSSYTESMPFAYGLGVLNMGLTPSEALIACTLNAAYGIGLARRAGSLDVGKQADFLVLEGESPAILAYHAGVSPVTAVYKKGRCLHSEGEIDL